MSKHYDNIAEDFDDSWLFSEEYREWYTDKIINVLEIQQDDIMLDIGCGTGIFTKKIVDKSLLSSAICIENTLSMCEISKQYEVLDIVCSDALEYFKSNRMNFNKLLFKEVLHHLDNRKLLFSSISKHLAQNGKILIVTRPKKVEFPFFEAAHQSFSRSQPDYNIFIKELEQSGLKVEVAIEKYEITLTVERWNKMLKSKFMSNLAEFTDAELEQGILEISKFSNQNKYKFNDNLIFILASK